MDTVQVFGGVSVEVHQVEQLCMICESLYGINELYGTKGRQHNLQRISRPPVPQHRWVFTRGLSVFCGHTMVD